MLGHGETSRGAAVRVFEGSGSWVDWDGSGWLWDGGDAGEDGDDVFDPGPGCGESQPSAPAAAGDAGWHVQQPVPQRPGFAGGGPLA